MRYSLVWVCQQGSLEIKAMLLAASLQRYAQCDCELVAAIPTPESHWGKPAARTLSFLARLGVRLAPIRNEISLDYPIGNKISCLGIPTDADVRIFLDSDLLCARPFTEPSELDAPFCAAPADIDSFAATEATWALIYGSQQLPLPTERIRAGVSGELMLPYFNAGFIAVQSWWRSTPSCRKRSSLTGNGVRYCAAPRMDGSTESRCFAMQDFHNTCQALTLSRAIEDVNGRSADENCTYLRGSQLLC